MKLFHFILQSRDLFSQPVRFTAGGFRGIMQLFFYPGIILSQTVRGNRFDPADTRGDAAFR